MMSMTLKQMTGLVLAFVSVGAVFASFFCVLPGAFLVLSALSLVGVAGMLGSYLL